MSTPNPFDPTAVAAAAAMFMKTSGVAAQWPTVGHVVEGIVTDFRMRDIIDQKTNETVHLVGTKQLKQSETPNKTGEGYPIAQQMLLDLQCEPTGVKWETNQYVPVAIPDDDGMRTAYVKGALKFAIGQAMQKGKAGTPDQWIGARVRIERTADRPSQDRTKGPAHQFTAVWTPPVPGAAAANDFMQQAAQAPAAPAAPGPWDSQQAQPAPAGWGPQSTPAAPPAWTPPPAAPAAPAPAPAFNPFATA